METLDYLLEKFSNGTATDIEKQLLLKALSVNEQQLMALLEKEFNSNIGKQVELISQERALEIFEQIQQKKSLSKVKTDQPTARVLPWRVKKLKWLAAACIAGILIIGGYLQQHSVTNKHTESVIAKARQLKTVSNSFAERITKTLPDGSIVTLEPRSAVSYYQPFDATKRDISLTGKAFFKVAKDPSKPFTVYANDIATTALGTEFWVDARLDTISVKLLEGKVMVSSVNNKMAMNVVYLKPGEQLSINKHTGAYAVTDFKTGSDHVKPVYKKTTNPVTLAFSKTPLAEVFNKIGKRYNVEIKYRAKELQTLSFTGTFLMNDSLQTILNIICNTNDLTFKQENGVVVISK